ncbi:MAG: glycosyltransferase involved in cell wall biosynthesis [Colwellia sp.]|jgi:glycosyltransferase involved in cell wall biosynthesis
MNISVVITFFNKGGVLIQAVESVYAQIGRNDEIIIVDDCSSTELSHEVLIKAKRKFKTKIKFFKTPDNGGAAYAKDYGVRRSSNEIIVLLDADDTLPNGAINKIKNKFNTDKETDLVFGNYIKRDLDKDKYELVDCGILVENGSLNPEVLIKKWVLLGSSPFKKTVYIQLGGFDKFYPKTDDVDFHKKLLVKGYKCSYVNDVIYIWNKSITGNNARQTMEDRFFSEMRNIEFHYRFSSIMMVGVFFLKNFVRAVYLRIIKNRDNSFLN